MRSNRGCYKLLTDDSSKVLLGRAYLPYDLRSLFFLPHTNPQYNSSHGIDIQ